MLGLLIVFGSLLTGLLVESVSHEESHDTDPQDLSDQIQEGAAESSDSGSSSGDSLLDWASDPSLLYDDEIFADEEQSSDQDNAEPYYGDPEVVESAPATPAEIVIKSGNGNFTGATAGELLSVRNGYFGTIDTAAGDDTISALGPDAGVATVNIDRPGLRDFVWIDERFEALADAPLSVRAGDGNDSIKISGAGIEVSTGDGEDHVYMTAASQAVIWANAGDQVYGSDLAGLTDLHVLIDGTGHFFGGTADEHAIALNDGAILAGGSGNDTLESDDGSAELRGDAGNDILSGNIKSELFQDGSTDRINHHLDFSSDSLFGGSGDDELFLGRRDEATGGTGADHFTIFDNYDDGDAAVIRDFDPSEDRLVIYSGETEGYPTDGSTSLRDRISVLEQDGTTIVMNGNDVLARLEGVTKVSIGFATQNAEGVTAYVSLDGVNSAYSSFDVLIAAFPATSS